MINMKNLIQIKKRNIKLKKKKTNHKRNADFDIEIDKESIKIFKS